ncbi:RHS repeat-associated core domain-containing protein [Orenia marismortui]|uniref:RHS repeat-associated core domain-containing protein n=1 Tax=Orenia marismortui TaxID=46469 RepID=UPI0003A0A67A|nr:RHS repeat-associated core domain-containing protein [Orenia marismortui]
MDQDYMPFGGDLARPNQIEVQNDSGESYKYTGQKQVASIGLYYYGARYYDPSIGRFITEDSYRGELDKPQSQNVYIYVMNNPLRYTDPTGNVSSDVFEYENIFEGIWNEEVIEPMKNGWEYGVNNFWENSMNTVKDTFKTLFSNNLDVSTKYSKTALGTDNNKDNPNGVVQMNMGKGEMEYYDVGGRGRIAGIDTNFKTLKWGDSDSLFEGEFRLDTETGVAEYGLGIEVTEGHKNLNLIDRGFHSSAGAYATTWEGGINAHGRISNFNVKFRLYGTALGAGAYGHAGANYKDSEGTYHYLEATGVFEKFFGININVDIYSQNTKETSKK